MVEPFLQYIDHRPHLREEKQPPLIKLSAKIIVQKFCLQKKTNKIKKLAISLRALIHAIDYICRPIFPFLKLMG